MLQIRSSDTSAVILKTAVCPSGSPRSMQSQVLQLLPPKPGLDGVEGAGEVKDSDGDSGVGSVQCRICLMQQMDDGIIYTDLGLVGILKWVL